MKKGILTALALTLLVTPFTPLTGFCHSYYYNNYNNGAAVAWGVAGLFVGSALTALAYRPPPAVVYAQPAVVYAPPSPPPVVYSYAPPVPQGLCRWERGVLDRYGRAVLDRYGRPVKEYTMAPCNSQPY